MSLFDRQGLLTDSGSVSRADISTTRRGMAHFANTGPSGTLCGGCAQWRGACLQFARMMSSAPEIPVPATTPSCRYWSKAPAERVTRAFALAEDDVAYMASIPPLAAGMRDLAGFNADVILADPPWTFRTRSERGEGRSARRHYALMPTSEIMALGPQIDAIAARDCACFLWATSPLLPDAFRVLEAWGFRFVSVVFVWVKTAKCGAPHQGMGFWSRAGAEFVLLGTRGHPKRLAKDVGQVVLERRGAHSEKPLIVHHLIERLVAGDRRVELFSRRPVLGWTSWGTEEGVG